MIKIILHENSFRKLIKEHYMNDIIDEIINYLNINFIRSVEIKNNIRGGDINKPIFLRKKDNKPIVPKEVFYFLQDKYKYISNEKIKRDELLKQVMKDWYNKFYEKNKTLSKNLSL